jgi:hypothetical protein
MCVDGGTNILLMGRVFRVLDYSNRYVDMMGFSSNIKIKQVRIASGVALYTDENGIQDVYDSER